MFRRKILRLLWLAVALPALPACDQAVQEGADADTRSKLVGTWLREIDEGGFKVRRVLVLESDGRFHESTRAVDADGSARRATAEGYWIFDGLNFKRKYTKVESHQFAGGRITFATFQIRFASAKEFTGIDNVRKVEVTYRRVDENTAA